MRFRTLVLWAIVAGLVAVAGCGDGTTPGDADGGADGGGSGDGGGGRDASDDASSMPMRCGNGDVEGTETCDDGNRTDDDGCSADCALECGDGTVSGAELCDTAIAAGEAGACPASCDDGVACTQDILNGAACTAECAHADITAAANDDGCCPSGATATTDNDCPGSCGDGLVTGSESCDTGIAAGSVGACPTTCDDGMNCTADVLQMAGTCDATCTNTPITAPADGDTCCPTGATLATDSDCPAACGDGVLSAGENCDTAIAAGSAGACPTACDDGMACTNDTLAGAGTCAAQCTSSVITTPANGDGCCPAGATIATDNDCTATCGDGVVTGGEACDTAITSGAGRCPTTCSDGMACTSDMLTGAGTCAATCSFPAITAPANGDGCCPPGATRATDNDCPIVCGDGVVSAGETCDTGIASGTGSCPTTCSDGMVCTRDVLANMGTCTAACTFPAITTPMNGDGCCPTGATIGTDNDCAARCGDSVVTAPETCDDGNTTAGDGCSATCTLETVTPTAFRLSALTLRDPHVYTRVFGICVDGTSQIQTQLTNAITMDGTDMDTPAMLDLSIAQVFRPLDQRAGSTIMSDVVFPDCTAPMSSTMCTLAAGAAHTPAPGTNMGTGTCLAPLPGTFRSSYGTITSPMGPCYVSNVGDLVITISGIPITLRQTSVAATYSGTPATQLTNGLIRGFLTEADANATTIPASVQFVGGMMLSAVLPGGSGNCRTGSNSDMDMLADGTRGWWFYLNFTAAAVPYTEL